MACLKRYTPHVVLLVHGDALNASQCSDVCLLHFTQSGVFCLARVGWSWEARLRCSPSSFRSPIYSPTRPFIHPSTHPSFCSSRAESGCPSSRIFGLQQVVSARLLFFLRLGLKKKKKEKKSNKLSDVICDNLVCVCAHIAILTCSVTKVFLLNAIKNI